ncbi:hypothetical protein HK099_001821 [Clydaea vesicula]|uniref:Amino acid permease/ SLC12A domain-containing protein n=1 Tax=Clydaea vesicula TaxID=447962 RepID=A0AAD5U6K2_9FUNG|nr:hypothetical protein HK099_001821 [Clydaea vesicula]
MSKFLNKAGSQLDINISELQGNQNEASNRNLSMQSTTSDLINKHKLGTFPGVFVPVFLSIWGIILFLRFGYILGSCGLIWTLILFTISYLITSSTSLSLSAISTNGTVEGGGPYYLISRSLGPEFGGSIGLIFYFGTILTAAINVLGFTETFIYNFGEKNGSIFRFLPESEWLYVLYSSLLFLMCLAICLNGAQLFARASILLLGILTISTISIYISLIFRPAFSNPELKLIFTGLKKETLVSNLWSNFEGISLMNGLQNAFAIVFPACTGILAGASMSGDLKSPSRSIPRGTLGGVFFTYILYASLGVLLASSVDRKSLKIDLSIMQDISYIPLLVTLGSMSTSLFSALGSLFGASLIIQAIAKDKLIKALEVFDRVEPNRALVFSWILVQSILIFVSQLDDIAIFATMFSLLTFLVLNMACFLLRITGSVNFRPSFIFFSWKTALIGVISSFLAMFIVNQLYAALSVLMMSSLFLFLHLTAPPKAWGDVMQSLIYHQVRKYLLRLDSRKEHVKFWRPQILVLINSPTENYLLIKFCNDLKKGGLFVLGHILKGDFAHRINDYKAQEVRKVRNYGRFNFWKGMKPNIIVLGFFEEKKRSFEFFEGNSGDSSKTPKMSISSWKKPSGGWSLFGKKKSNSHEHEAILSDIANGISVESYVGIIEDTLQLNKAVAIARNFESLEQISEAGSSMQLPSQKGKRQIFNKAPNIAEEFHSETETEDEADIEENMPLIDEESDSGLEISKTSYGKRYIDLWPIQMASSDLGTACYSFETYTMVLQMGTILHMNWYWKQNYHLRVMVFVELEEDVDEEVSRVKLLLKAVEIKEYELQINKNSHCKPIHNDFNTECNDRNGDSESYSNPTNSGTRYTTKPRRKRSLMATTKIPQKFIKNIGSNIENDTTNENNMYFETTQRNSPIRSSPVESYKEENSSDENFNSFDIKIQHKILNQLMKKHSSEKTTSVIFSALHAPEKGTSFSKERSENYIEEVNVR